MARRTTVSVVTFVVLASAAMSAEAHRFHPLTPELQRRLRPVTRSNADAVIRYGESGRATAVLVDGTPGVDNTALVLTNHHVYLGAPSTRLVFADGQTANLLRLVSSYRDLDYALVEIDLPAATRARPVTLGRGDVSKGEAVYAVSASANPFRLNGPLEKSTAVGRFNRQAVEEARKAGAMRTIQRGEHIGSKKIKRMPVQGEGFKVPSFVFNLPNAAGASGSPIFSSRSHRMVALHWGGGSKPDDWESSGVPMRYILDHLGGELAKGLVPADLAPRLRSLLDGSPKP